MIPTIVRKSIFTIVLLLCLIYSGCTLKDDSKPIYWPQSSGPNGNWQLLTKENVPSKFSVRTGENVLWKMELPEVGQGGITIWKDKIFLTVMKPIYAEQEKESLKTNTILALCIDATNQKILWQKELAGTITSPYFYGFSDSTTPAPITDGEHVWFFNASGVISCFDLSGNLMWKRTWNPVEQLGKVHYPFNKQFEPLLLDNLIINMEPYWKEDGKRVYGWNYLYALNKTTGEEVWISEKSLTHYNTPFFNTTRSGVPAMLIGRGAHHKVPESPKGYSLINLETGKSIWNYETNEGMAMYNSVWTKKYALWFTETESVVHKIDVQTGQLIEKISLTSKIDFHTFDTINQKYVLQRNFNLKDSSSAVVFPAWYTNSIVGDKCYFMCFKKNQRFKLNEPEYAIGRVDLNTGKAEYLEVPVQYEYQGDKKVFDWHVDLTTETKNIRGLDIAFDKRSQRDGWIWNFNANPICINQKLFFTTMSGLVYCIDTTREEFDETSLISINDLGPKGETWTLNTPSFSKGKLYHRTSKYLICIGSNE